MQLPWPAWHWPSLLRGTACGIIALGLLLGPSLEGSWDDFAPVFQSSLVQAQAAIGPGQITAQSGKPAAPPPDNPTPANGEAMPTSDPPATAEASPTPSFPSTISSLWQTNAQLEARWVRLDGVRLFQIAGWTSSGLSNRYQDIQQRLNRQVQGYLRNPEAPLSVEQRESNQQPVIYINDQYLLTVTELDAQYQGLATQAWAEQVRLALANGLDTALAQRQPDFLWPLARQSLVLLLMAASAILLLGRWSQQLSRRPIQLLAADKTPLLQQRSRRHQKRLQEIQRLLILAAQGGLGLGSILYSLYRFPQTRSWLLVLEQLLKLPLILVCCSILAYLLIRLSHITIDRFSLALSQNPLLPTLAVERSQQRISTLSQVVKGLALLLIFTLMLLIALTWAGVNIGPLLAGAGILGVGISLASQGLIKDAINGVLIILEDQYGVGDIVQIAEWTGLVETLNLRMTQLRTSEGKLVTIPNGEVRMVANLSSNWSQVDLNIPVAYGADLEKVIVVIEATALAMAQEEPWASLILEPPSLKGVEDFSDRGLLVKLWIKTQPLKQWDVAREYRRRLKQALDQAGLEIPIPQRAFWLQPPHVLEHYSESP